MKPMLAASLDGVDLKTLRYPLLVSPKLDGVRCIVWEGVAYSRNWKPIRNRFVQTWASSFHNLDGELIVGSPVHDETGEPLGRTQSGVMSFDGEPNFTFHLFDTPDNHHPFTERLDQVQAEMDGEVGIENVEHFQVVDQESLIHHEEEFLRLGYEGVMLRDPLGPYKHGRSTLREGWLMKLKRFQDGEAVVTGLEEAMHNANELQRDELGRAKRSKHQENLVPAGMVGTILALSEEWGELRIAPGVMTHFERTSYWNNRDKPGHTIIGKTIHWRSFGYGVKDKPRFARFYGLRSEGI